MKGRFVALLTDFGTRDAYVGVMKAVLLGHDPSLTLIDLSHEVPPQDLLSGAYLLYSAWDFFPAGSTFCAVVDPGVGSERGTLLARIRGRYLVAPDNGLISLLARMYTELEVFALKEDALPRPGASISSTFHGRDLFAPAAALCAAGKAGKIRGQPLAAKILSEVYPTHSPDGRSLSGRVLHIDRFGNCITSVHRGDLAKLAVPHDLLTVTVGPVGLEGLANTYADVPAGAPLCLLGSSGFLEVSVREGNASQKLGIAAGGRITLTAGLTDSTA